MGSGGARFGAGRPAYRLKAEQCLRLDIRELARRGYTQPGASGTWRWTNNYSGQEVGAISLRTDAERVLLFFSANGTARSQSVQIRHTPCTYGGTRPWFRCPTCWRRVAVLYFRAASFTCRHCARVAYCSQSEDDAGRSWRLQRKIEAKLGEDWERPKYMHQATYERLLSRLDDCEARRDAGLAVLLARLMPDPTR